MQQVRTQSVLRCALLFLYAFVGRGDALTASGLMQALERALHDRCLYIDAGWWGYELCWARHLRQFYVPELDAEQKLESVHLLGASAFLAAEIFDSVSPAMHRPAMHHVDDISGNSDTHQSVQHHAQASMMQSRQLSLRRAVETAFFRCCRPVSCCQAAQGAACPTFGMPCTPGMWIAETRRCLPHRTDTAHTMLPYGERCRQCSAASSACVAEAHPARCWAHGAGRARQR